MLCGEITDEEGRVWALPGPVSDGAPALDLFDECRGDGHNPEYEAQLATQVVDAQGTEINHEAELPEKKIEYLRQAGENATQVSANPEAVGHFRKALERLATLPEGRERASQELAVQTSLTAALVATSGYAAPEVRHTAERVRELCGQVGDTSALSPTLIGLGSYYSMSANYTNALEVCRQNVRLAEKSGDPLQIATSYWVPGMTRVFLGEFLEARQQLEHVIAYYDQHQPRNLGYFFGLDPGVACWSGDRIPAPESDMRKPIGPGILAAFVVAAAPAAMPQDSSGPTPFADDAQREAFLLEGEIVHDRAAGGGRTNSRRVTLRRGDVEHDAHVQTHDVYKSQVRMPTGPELDFRDSWRNNVAAYRLDRLLGLGMVPTTVVRHFRGKTGAYTWWVDDVMMSEKDRYLKKMPAPDPAAWNRQMYVVRVFDQLIFNFDRSVENLLIDSHWRLWMIDHTRSFKVFKDLRNEKNLADTCDRRLLAALRTLDKATLEKTMDDLLNGTQIGAVLARRDKIVRNYDKEIKARSEDAVLYDLLPRLPSTEP